MKKIAVIGDLIKDEYLYTSSKNNPEHSGPCYNIIKIEVKEGGAGNVVENLFALGLRPDFYHPKTLCTKTRVINDGQYVCRIDKDILNKDKHWINAVNWDNYDYIVVSDYNKGAITKQLARELIKSTAKVIVDCKPNHAAWFKGVYLLKVNVKEYNCMYDNSTNIGFQNIVVTYGDDGLMLFDGEKYINFAGYKVKTIDVTGAGDTVLATLTWALCKGNTLVESCKLANKAGSIAVQHMGCYAVKAKELV